MFQFSHAIKGLGLPLAVATLLLATSDATLGDAIPEGQWQGTWYPGGSCRDTKEREMTAQVYGGQISGRVENQHGQPGIFSGEILQDGSFQTNVIGLKRYSFTLFGQASPKQITGSWTTRNDCGRGKFVLAPIDVTPAAVTTTTQPPTEAASATTDDKVVVLQRLYQQGLITETEYREKLANLQATTAPGTAPTTVDARVQALGNLYQQGLITETEYQKKLSELTAAASAQPAGQPAVSVAPQPDPRLEALQRLHQQGLITDEEYARKAAEITGSSE